MAGAREIDGAVDGAAVARAGWLQPETARPHANAGGLRTRSLLPAASAWPPNAHTSICQHRAERPGGGGSWVSE